eukprot:7939724-Pyramimonas_sp.AAC.1
MPGAERALAHLLAKGVPMVLATSTPRTTLEKKVANHPILQKAFTRDGEWCVVTGDEVKEGKPSPEIFLKVAPSPARVRL